MLFCILAEAEYTILLMHILITGGSGLVGSYITGYLQQTGHIISAPTAAELDITQKEDIQRFVEKVKPDILVHCAAYTDVTKAEQERDDQNGKVWNINVNATAYLTQLCRQKNIRFIHISTDMVFCGLGTNRGPYQESDPIETDTNTLSWYGASKAQAEREVHAADPHATIIRISNPIRSHYDIKQDYLHKLLAVYDAKKPMSLFTDQYLTISYIPDIARAIEVIIAQSISGTFHVSSPDLVTPFAFGTYAIKICRNDSDFSITESTLEEYFLTHNTRTRYLQYGGLRVIKTQEQLAVPFTPWKSAIDAIHRDELRIL